MTRIPKNIGLIYFVGIGGIGMCGLAQILFDQGFAVKGSDIEENSNVKMLKALDIQVTIGHKAQSIEGAAVVVKSSAIKDSNVEIVEAKARKIPVISRAEMLAEIMYLRHCIGVAGSHGKSTTTSLIGSVLGGGGMDPTVVNGGIINAYASTYRLGESKWMVVEADESDGSFLKLPVLHAVVTNIDNEHMNHFGDFASICNAFKYFLQNTPFYGCCFLCRDDENIQALIGDIKGRKIITYGLSPNADVCADNLAVTSNGQECDVIFRNNGSTERLQVSIPMFGKHNLVNCLAALAVGNYLGIDKQNIQKSLSNFSGVMRRFQLLGEFKGAKVISDYAHHPKEIEAVLAAARQTKPTKVTAIFQPHRYSRLSDLFDNFCRCFDKADRVLISPVYDAGEDPLPGFDHKTLVAGIKKTGHRDAEFFDDHRSIYSNIMEESAKGDLIIFMGAGSVHSWAKNFINTVNDKVGKVNVG